MNVRKKTKTTVTVYLELDEWEARDLAKMLERIRKQPQVSKSEFSMREKATGRHLLVALNLVLQRRSYILCQNPECPQTGKCGGECARNF